MTLATRRSAARRTHRSRQSIAWLTTWILAARRPRAASLPPAIPPSLVGATGVGDRPPRRATAKIARRHDDGGVRCAVPCQAWKPRIEVTGLRKRFGHTVALDGLTFTVTPGNVTGFVGPNGAGKSTTMRVILGLDAVDEGTALVGGRPYASLRQPAHPRRLAAGRRRRCTPAAAPASHLLWMAHSQGLPLARVDEVIEQAGLGAVARRKAGGYSLGMRQRLGVAAAMLGDPPVVMLDEPFNGLDPEGIVWMRGFLRSLAAEGRAVFVSSHLMSELEDTATHLVVIGRGRLVADTERRRPDRRGVRRPGRAAHDRARRRRRRCSRAPARRSPSPAPTR